MVDGGYDIDPQIPAAGKPVYENEQGINESGEYGTAEGDQPCPPAIEEGDKNTSGGFETNSAPSVCSPGIEEGNANTSGEYETEEGSNTGQNENEHPDDCGCEECCFYTETIPNTQTVGGHEEGQTYDTVPMREMWYQLLHPYQPPSITLSVNKLIFEVGECLSNMTFNWATDNSENTIALSTKIMSKTNQAFVSVVSSETYESLFGFIVEYRFSVYSEENYSSAFGFEIVKLGVVTSIEEYTANFGVNRVIKVAVDSEEIFNSQMLVSKIAHAIAESHEQYTSSFTINRTVNGQPETEEVYESEFTTSRYFAEQVGSEESYSFVFSIQTGAAWVLANGYWDGTAPWTADGLWETV